jgi:hypothetical protein
MKYLQIEFAISKAQNLCHQVQSRVKQCVEAKQPEQVIRNSQFQKTFNETLKVHFGR